MEIKYRIVETYPDEHQVLVRFFTDALPESQLVSAWKPDGVTPYRYRTDYLITLPVPVPTGEAFNTFILGNCPVYWFDLKAKIADPAIDTTMASLEANKGQVGALTASIPAPYIPTDREMAKADRHRKVAAIVVTTKAGNSFNGDETSQDRMSRAVVAMGAAPAGSTVNWVLADNRVIDVTQRELTEALLLAGSAQAAIWVI